MSYTFDVIIPTFNNLPDLIQCLEGFSKQTFKDFRVIVCIDGSTDGTNEYIDSLNYEFEILRLNHPGNENKGRAATRNLALTYLDSEYILFIDSDILPFKDLLKYHFELLSTKDCISIGEVIYKDRDKNIWSFYLQTRGKGKHKNLDVMPSYYLNTQNVALLTKHFVEVGGHDSDLTKWYGAEDTVLGYLIEKKFNIPTIFNKSAVAFSESESSLEEALKRLRGFGNINLKIIKEKYPDLNKIFKFNLMDSNAIYIKFFKFFLKDSVSNALMGMLRIFPPPIKLRIIQFLVFNSIYQGYKSK